MIAELSFAVCLAFNGHCLSRKHALMQWAYRFLFCAITYVLLWKTVQQTILQFPEVYVWWRFSIQSSKQKQVSYRTEAIEKWRYWSSCSDELACKFIEKSKWTHKQSSTDQCCDLDCDFLDCDFLPFLPRFLVPVRMSDATPPLSSRLLLPRAAAFGLLERAAPNLAHGDGPWPVLQRTV